MLIHYLSWPCTCTLILYISFLLNFAFSLGNYLSQYGFGVDCYVEVNTTTLILFFSCGLRPYLCNQIFYLFDQRICLLLQMHMSVFRFRHLQTAFSFRFCFLLLTLYISLWIPFPPACSSLSTAWWPKLCSVPYLLASWPVSCILLLHLPSSKQF